MIDIEGLSIELADLAGEECGHLPGPRPCTRCIRAAVKRGCEIVEEHYRNLLARHAAELSMAANHGSAGEVSIVSAGVDPRHQTDHCDYCLARGDSLIQTTGSDRPLTLCPTCYHRAGNNVR